jgi:hypothetical protein
LAYILLIFLFIFLNSNDVQYKAKKIEDLYFIFLNFEIDKIGETRLLLLLLLWEAKILI